MNQKFRLFTVLAAVALIVTVAVLQRRSRQISAENDSSSSGIEETAGGDRGPKAAVSPPAEARLILGAPVGSPEDQKVLTQLQDLLDDADRHQEAKALAMTMATSGSDLQQLAAVNALRWIGGRDAKKTLVKVMGKAGEEVSGEALRALTHLFNQDLVAEHPDPFDPALWKEAIQNAFDSAERESLFVLMGAHPARDTVPLLLDLQESRDNDLAELATEYLEANTGGTEIQNRQQGEEWLAEHLQEQEVNQQEEAQEKARDAETAPQDLPRFVELNKLLSDEAPKTETKD